MDTEDTLLFSELMHAYKRLYIRHQEFKHLLAHPEVDPETVREQCFEKADDLFRPLADLLVARQPLQAELRRLVLEIDHLQV